MEYATVASGRHSQVALIQILLVVLLMAAPALAFFLLLNREVPLTPLVGLDIACAKCDRKATRTLPSVADSLRDKNVYVYDRAKYPKGAPAWCDSHGPDKGVENAFSAYLGAVGVFVITALLYKRLARD